MFLDNCNHESYNRHDYILGYINDEYLHYYNIDNKILYNSICSRCIDINYKNFMSVNIQFLYNKKYFLYLCKNALKRLFYFINQDISLKYDFYDDFYNIVNHYSFYINDIQLYMELLIHIINEYKIPYGLDIEPIKQSIYYDDFLEKIKNSKYNINSCFKYYG